MNRRVTTVVAATSVGAGVALFLTAAGAKGDAFGPTGVLLLFVVLQASSWFASFRMQAKEEDETWQLDEAVFVAAALILEPLGAVLVFAVGVAVGGTLTGTSPLKMLFNAAQFTLASAVGVSLALALAPLDATAGGLAAAVVGAVAFAAVNTLTMTAILRAAEGIAWSSVTERLGTRVVQWITSASVGVLAGVGGSAYEWAPLFAVPPIIVVHVVVNEHLRARRDRQRIDGLFQTAVASHASVQTEDVQLALSEAAARLLACGQSAVLSRPPGDGQFGVPISVDGSEQWWLVVAEPRSGQPFDDEDRHLLEAISAVGASALDNARLVSEIRRQALHDTLTDLPNQLLFEDRVRHEIRSATRERERFAVVVLDLDAFKKVNDSLGHKVGDEVLIATGERITGAVRDVDTVARLGSDHFTLLLPDVGSPETMGVLAEKILAAVREPLHVAGHEVYMTASLGVAFFPDDGREPGHLLRNADSAMHKAKETGRDGYRIYTTGMNELAHLRLARESELHLALERDELAVVYQPQIDLRTNRIVGFEALVRWDHPVLGRIGPAEFVPLAEQSGLIVEVDEWVLHRAASQMVAWDAAGVPRVRIAVNLSGRHFTSDRIVETVRSLLAGTGLDPTRLELEVTEGIAVQDGDATVRIIERIRALGVQFAIDDFGTGYSVLGRLQRFPVDRLKIDQSFIGEITSAHGEAPIVVAMIAMARSLRLEVVAEGVETLEQQTFLRHHACDQAQGFLFSKPVVAEDAAALLSSDSRGLNIAG